MKQLIKAPPTIPLLLRAGIWLSERVTGKRMVPARLLAWSTRLAMGAAVFEGLVVHKDPTLSPRLLKLVRMQVSFFVACPFCIDMNAAEWEHHSITDKEIKALQGLSKPDQVETFNDRELTALELAIRISRTPLQIEQPFSERLQQTFTDREILVLTATAAQVNYWARLIQFLGIAPAGFTALSTLVAPRNSKRSDP